VTARNLTRFVLGVALVLTVSAAVFAQYPGGTTGAGGTATSGGVYTAPKGGYSSSTGAAIGAGAAAGLVAGYLVLRHRRSMVGCVEKSADGIRLVSEKNKKTYTLDAGNLDLRTGDRVRLKGKKKKTSSGMTEFSARKLVKDYGSCGGPVALKQPANP
jgi:hypothetical protein